MSVSSFQSSPNLNHKSCSSFSIASPRADSRDIYFAAFTDSGARNVSPCAKEIRCFLLRGFGRRFCLWVRNKNHCRTKSSDVPLPISALPMECLSTHASMVKLESNVLARPCSRHKLSCWTS